MKTENEAPLVNGEIKNTDSEKVVEVIDLVKTFGSQEVLQSISLHLMKAENLVVLGKSGSGKSVLIKCIVGLMNYNSGTINVLGNDVAFLNSKNLNELRKKIGFLFQSGALYDSMTVKQNLEFPLRRVKKELTEAEIKSKVAEVLENVGLADALDKMPSQLSGGMRKRISLARTLVLDPMIMLYDEPTTGLDPVTSGEISMLINSIKKSYKTSSIIITHDIKCAQITADRIVMLQDGVVYKEGTLNAFEKSEDPVVQSFFK